MITTFAGPNAFLVNKETLRITTDFIKNFGDFATEKVDGEEVEFQRIIEAIQALPFLSDKRLVVLKNPSAIKEFSEKFEDLINTVPESSDVIIVETKLDKRTVYSKQLKKLTEFKEFSELDEGSLKKWAIDYCKEKKGEISYGNASYLVDLLGADQYMLANEIQKLISYQPQISKESIDLLVEPTPQSTVFELIEAGLGGNAKKALKIYDEQRLKKVEPQEIMGLLAWQLHVLALVKTAGDKSADQIASEAKIHPFVVRKALNITRRLTLVRLKELVAKALSIDSRSKTEGIDIDEALKNYLIELSR